MSDCGCLLFRGEFVEEIDLIVEFGIFCCVF